MMSERWVLRVAGFLRGMANTGASWTGPAAGLLAVSFMTAASASPAEAQILNRLRERAEDALDRTSVIQRLLEEPPGITTSIHDAHTELPFLDDHNPEGSADMAGLPRDARNAFFAPPGLYEMEAMSYCLHAGTYGPSGGDGYSLAPLEGDLAQVIRTLVRRSVDHPEISQDDLQSLIWALQSRVSIDDLSPELQSISQALLDPGQLNRLSENFIDMAKEELLIQARDHMPDPVRRVAEVEASLRDLLRSGADFDELEEAAVLVGVPPREEWVREVPALRWNYHPDGYFIRFSPDGYQQTYVQTYVPEQYRLERDSEGRVAGIVGPRGARLVFEYGEGPAAVRGKLSLLRGVRVEAGEGAVGGFEGEWAVEGWALMGNDLIEEAPRGLVEENQFARRRREARERRRNLRAVLNNARRSDSDRGPGVDLADLGHIRTGLQQARGEVPDEVLAHLANAWQYSLCVEAGGCAPARVAGRTRPEERLTEERLALLGLHGPVVDISEGLAERLEMSSSAMPYPQAGGGASMDPGGNVAAPGNTGSQRLLQSGKPTLEKANLAMKALGILLALADVIGSGSLGTAAYNALGMGGLPVGHLGLPMMMAGAMISQVTSVWSTATDALAGNTGGGDSGGGDSGGGDWGDSGGGEGVGSGGDFGDLGGEDRTESRSDGEDYENTPPPNPPPNPSPLPAGGGGSSGHADAANSFTESLLVALHHTQAVSDSELRRGAALAAGDSEWAGMQAALVGEHQRLAGLGMMEAARRLDHLMEFSSNESGSGSEYAFQEDLAGVQDRLRTEGWAGEELGVARLLGITGAEMEGLRQHLLSLDPETLEGDLVESAHLWAKELRTSGILWQALASTHGIGR